jgi:PAS domain S-box-containing protein
MARDVLIGDVSRPLFGPSFWGPLLLIAAATAAIVHYGMQVIDSTRENAVLRADAGGSAVAREIVGFIDREHERLHAFTEEKQDAIARILADPDDVTAIEALQASVKRMFRGAFAFSVTDATGEPLFEDFDGLVGPVCKASMRDAATAFASEHVPFTLPPIHPVPGAYHFDLISPWQLDNGEQGLFFISMSPDRIAELIAVAERASGNRILLLNRDNPTLIEVSAAGARDRLGGQFRFEPEIDADSYFAADLPGTHWRLVALPDVEALDADVMQISAKIAASILALMLVTVALLFLVRRSERRNSSLFTRSLQSSVSRQRAILQSMVDGMVTIDASGEILNVNSAVTRLFGYAPNELVGSNVHMLMPEPDRSAHDGYLRHYLDTGESRILGKGREVRGRRKDGTVFPVLLTLGESVEGDQRIFVGILHDLSAYVEAKKQVEAQAVKIARSRQELDEISQVAANNLQLPLQRIAKLGELLASDDGLRLPGIDREKIKNLGAEAHDMSELARGIADFARSDEQMTPHLVDVREVLKSVCDDLALPVSAVGAQIEVHGDGSVFGDEKKLYQVLWNLLDNALKFRDADVVPQIVVTIGNMVTESGEDGLRLSIRDNGIGIPDDQLDAVFEAFRRLHPRDKYPGMGLGLSICRKIVDGLGGEISARGAEGGGTEFELILPGATGDPEADAGSA